MLASPTSVFEALTFRLDSGCRLPQRRVQSAGWRFVRVVHLSGQERRLSQLGQQPLRLLHNWPRLRPLGSCLAVDLRMGGQGRRLTACILILSQYHPHA